MTERFATIGLGIALFAATNLDDLFVLLGFFADRRYRARQVVLGQYLGMAALMVASLVAAAAAVAIPGRYLGWLGIFPFLIGAKNLADAVRAKPQEEAPGPAGGASRALGVALVTVANGGDNIAAWVPVFAARGRLDLAIFAATFAAMTGAWCLAGWLLVNHRRLGPPIRRYGSPTMPWLLMALGVWIFLTRG